ncbi:hypothetical protein ABS648_03405 [Pseudomonas solani]|uniref:Head-tail adaptor protein n=1 Tax=Pseudomonas solani TaxID=2731552 RepID=A0AAU7Y772_9PSED
MRAGELRHRAEILALSPDLVACSLGFRWVGIRVKDSADVQAAGGLRVGALVEVRARWSADLVQGRYLRHSGRLLRIANARDFKGDRSELVMSCEEFVGEPAEYRPAGLAPVCCRVHLRPVAPYVDDDGRMTDYQLAAQVALIEVGRIQVDDQLVVAGRTYNVIDYVNESDDGVVRSVWLEDLLCG